MSSKAASAVYPHLSKAEEQRERVKSGSSTLPGWATSNDPAWSEPRKIPNRFDRIPGLKRKPIR
jgi:hypothetical protein